MALHTVPWTLQSASHGAELFRQTTQSLLAGTGVIGSGDLQVTQNGTPNMSVNVAAGQIWIPGTLGGASAIGLVNLGNQSGYGLPTGLTTQGSYYTVNDGTVNLAIAAANPTNPRIDLVVASVQDSYYSGSTNTTVLQVVTGTPASSPSPPTPPSNTVVLAQIAVAANATQITSGNITDERPFLLTRGASQLFSAAAATGTYTTFATVATITIPAQPYPYKVLAYGHVRYTAATSGDSWNLQLIQNGTTVFAQDDVVLSGTNNNPSSVVGLASTVQPGASSSTISMGIQNNFGGHSTVLASDATRNFLLAMVVPL